MSEPNVESEGADDGEGSVPTGDEESAPTGDEGSAPTGDQESTPTDAGGDGGLLGPDPDWTPAALSSIRADRRKRAVALAVAALLGVAVAWVHWLGLFVAGALVGVVSRTLPRAVAAGVGVGVLVLVVTVVASPVMGPGEFLGLTPPVYVAVAAALLAPAWGSLLRGVV